MSVYTAYTGYKEKIEEGMFSEGYIHLIQPICIRAQTGTHQRFCLQLIFYVVHLRKRVYTAYIAYKRKQEKATFCKDYVHYGPVYIMLYVGAVKYLMITDNIIILHFLVFQF